MNEFSFLVPWLPHPTNQHQHRRPNEKFNHEIHETHESGHKMNLPFFRVFRVFRG